MRVHLGYIYLIFISALTLAQSNSVSFTNQPEVPPVGAHSLRDLPFGQRGPRTSKASARQHATSQTSGLSFANAVDYASGGENAVLTTVADVNGDGKPDLVVANSCPPNSSCTSPTDEGSVGVLLGNGNGTFRSAVVYDSGGALATWVAIADVNGDGKPDLLVTNLCANTSSCANGTVSVLLGNGDGTFQAAVAYDSGGIAAESVAVADMNGDGKPDLVVSNCTNCSTYGDGSVAMLLGNGDGTFQTAHVIDSGGYAPLSIAVADVNGDGKPDVIVGQCSGPVFGCYPGEVGVLLGNGDGTLQTAVNYSSGADQPMSVAVADVNGDGKLDILVSNLGTGSQGLLNGAVGVLLGNGDGTFQPAVIYDAGGIRTAGLAVADVNADGKLDVVVTDQSGSCLTGSTVAVLLGNGDGTFQPAVGFCFAGSLPSSVVAADVNGDGRPDLIATNRCGTTCGISVVGVLINTSTTVVLSPTSLNFAPQAPGTSSSPQTVTLTNRGTAALTLSGITISGANAAGFTQTNNCPSALAENASCQIKVTSVPQSPGSQNASLNVADNAPDSPQTVALTGIGQDFSLAVAPGTTSVTPGQAGNYTVTVSPLSGFSQKVTLTCSGAPPQSTCTLNPSSVTLNGSSNATANIAVATSGPSAELIYPGRTSPPGLLALWLAPLSLGLVVLGRPDGGRGRTRLLRVLALVCLFAVGFLVSSCGGGGSSKGGGSGTPTGTYVVSVTGTFSSGSAELTHTAKFTLVVQ